MKPYYSDDLVTLYHGDALAVLRQLPDASLDCCVTSPPYFGLRDYGVEGQYGLEASPAEYVETMRAVFTEVRRVLANDGTLWLNIGDSYSSKTKGTGGTGRSTLGAASGGNAISEAGVLRSQERQQMQARRYDMPVPEKNLLGIPWRAAFALQDDGWILRNDIIWSKPNAMPESVTDRLSCRHEHLFMLSKSRHYWFDLDPVREDRKRIAPPIEQSKYAGTELRGGRHGGNAMSMHTTGEYQSEGRNPGDVWSIPTQPFAAAHFACMPVALAERAILAGCKPGGTVLDPFSGSGTTGLAATKHGRKYVGIDLNAEYLDLSLRTRLADGQLNFGEVTA